MKTAGIEHAILSPKFRENYTLNLPGQYDFAGSAPAANIIQSDLLIEPE